MLIKILPTQIPLVWEHVKYAVAQINEIPPTHLSEALTRILYDLLSGKAQCWVTLNEDRVILNVSVTRIGVNTVTGERELHWLFFYAYQGTTEHIRKELVRVFRECAREEGCVRVTGASRNPRACELLEQGGFTPEYRTFALTVEG